MIFAPLRGRRLSLPDSSEQYRCADNQTDSGEEEESDCEDDIDNNDDEMQDGKSQDDADEGDTDGFNGDYNYEEGPLKSWRTNTCRAKLAIIAELKKENSTIHYHILDGKIYCVFIYINNLLLILLLLNRSY